MGLAELVSEGRGLRSMRDSGGPLGLLEGQKQSLGLISFNYFNQLKKFFKGLNLRFLNKLISFLFLGSY